MQMLVNFAVIALVVFIAERLAPERPLAILRRGIFADGLYVVSNIAIRIVFTDMLAITLTQLGRETLPRWSIDLLVGQPLWLQALSIIFVLDFFAYWMHRGKHRFGWWWRLHETHHSSVDLDWFSSVRFHPFEKILDRTLYLLPLMVLGASKPALLILASFDALVASLAHANLNLRYGFLGYLIVGPEMHRWHHSAQPDHQRKNFGNNLSLFDWIFGTAHIGVEKPMEYGLGDPDFAHENFLKQLAYPFRREKRH